MSSSTMDLGLDEDEPISIPLRRPLQNSSTPRDKEPLSDDLEKLQQWHEERMQRRLRGEYESAVQHLAELVNDSTERSGRLISVRVEGARRTRGSFLDALFAPYLFPSTSHGLYPFSAYNRSFTPQPAENVGDILRTGRHLTAQMLKTDLFKSVQARLEASRDVFAQEGDMDLVLRAPERGWFFAKTTTEVGNGEGSAGMTVRLRNIFGGAETLEGNVSTGTKTRRAFQGALSAPLLWMDPSLRTYGTLSVSGVRRDNTSFCSASEDIHSIRASLKTEALGRGVHEIAYNAAYRMIGDLTPSASISMRLAAGPSLKSSLAHTWTLDTQDNKIAGTSGAVTKLSQELAGLGGDAAFYKAEGEYTISRRVPGTTGMTWSLGAKAGGMAPLFGKSTLFPDRFQLGGPSNVRLFRSNSLGPHDGVDSLGGDMYWAAGLSLISDIPKKAHWPIKTHLFLNAGRLDNRNTSKSLSENIATLISQPSISAGVGLVYKFDWVRVEANFGVPLAAAASDGARKGFQVGMGIDFL